MPLFLALKLRWATLVSIFLFSTTILFAQETEFSESSYNVLFNVDKSYITKSEKDRFELFYDRNLKDATKINLVGHTDSDASNEYNQRLSESRVLTVKEKLIALGYQEDQITISHAGEEKPLNKNANAEEKRVNRRVHINWEKPPVEEEQLGDIHDLYKLLKQQNQKHCIDPTKDTMLRLEQGTIIGIPAYAFNTSSTECVTFEAKEVYKFSDMILENVATTSNGRLLETGGMLYTEALDSKGSKLKLNIGKELTVMLPTDTVRNDMKLFYGNDSRRGMNWNLAPGAGFRGYDFWYCYDWQFTNQCEKCPILSCRLFGRIDETFKGMTDSLQRVENKEFRDCQRTLRRSSKTSVNYARWLNSYCGSWYEGYGGGWNGIQDSLRKMQEARLEDNFEKWGVENLEEYRDTVQKWQLTQYEERMQNEYAKYDVDNQEAYEDTLRKIQMLSQEEQMDLLGQRIAEGKSDPNSLKYYVSGVTRMGWINCDAFSGSDEPKINMLIADSESDSETDCNLIFKDRKSIMKGYGDAKKKFTFASIISGLSVWVLTIKYRDGKIFLSLKDSKTQNSVNGTSFREVTVDELKTELRKLDV